MFVFSDDVQVILGLVAVAVLLAAMKFVRQQRAAALFGKPDSHANSAKRGQRRGLKRILKQQGSIELPFANLPDGIEKRFYARFAAAIFDDFVDQRRVLKQSGCQRRCQQGNVRVGKRSAQSFHCRSRHHRIAQPVGSANQYAFGFHCCRSA